MNVSSVGRLGVNAYLLVSLGLGSDDKLLAIIFILHSILHLLLLLCLGFLLHWLWLRGRLPRTRRLKEEHWIVCEQFTL